MCAALAAWPRLKESTTDFFGAIFGGLFLMRIFFLTQNFWIF